MRLVERARQGSRLTELYLAVTLLLGIWAAVLIAQTYLGITSPTYAGFPKAGFKALGATVVGLLAVGQVYTMEARLGHLPRGGIRVKYLMRAHRWGGRIALALAAAIGFFCMVDIGANTSPDRVVLHEVLGMTAFFAAAVKLSLLRFRPGLAMRVAPWLGRLLAVALIAIWFTSAFEYFTGTL